jgi:hypothetical protein
VQRRVRRAAIPPSVAPAQTPTPVKICSYGARAYRIVESRKLKNSRGVLQGVVHLLYSETDGSHCVTWKGWIGKFSYVSESKHCG